MIDQNQENFRKWLRSQHEKAEAFAGDPCHCWLAKWFESQGVSVWGVFPQHYLERSSDAPGGASQEILLDDPNAEDFDDSDRIPLEGWACNFGREVDRIYLEPIGASPVTRNQALSVLASIAP